MSIEVSPIEEACLRYNCLTLALDLARLVAGRGEDTPADTLITNATKFHQFSMGDTKSE